MNSTNNIEIVKQLVSEVVRPEKIEEIDQYQIAYVLKQEDVHRTLSHLKNAGWIQLSYLSAVDWPDDNKMEVVYIIMNWEKPVHIQIRTMIGRENPSMNSIISIYEGAKYYEREAHEFFGIAFPGNPDYEKQLILENWDDLPPLRKDFNPRAYSDAHFVGRDHSDDFIELNNKPSQQAKRRARKERIDALDKGGN